MQKRHGNLQMYFNEQVECTQKYVIPYIEKVMPISASLRVFEIGCGEAGNLKPFLDLACECVGVDLAQGRIEGAKTIYKDHPHSEKMKLLCDDIYNVNPQDLGTFDIIMLRDVIEHIPNQETFMHTLKRFMTPKSVLFIGFPVWAMPFGGHQQVSENKFLSHCPYIHLLPRFLYKKVLLWCKQNPQPYLDIYDTGLTIHHFEKILKTENYTILDSTHYFIQPNYEVKFGLRPCIIPKILQFPYFSDLYTSAMYYLLQYNPQ